MPERLPADQSEFGSRPLRWPDRLRLRILARDIRRRDAVGNFCFDLAAMFGGAGIPTMLHAENYDAGDTAGIRPIGETIATLTPDNVIFFNFSTEDPVLPELAVLPCRKIIYYHGITLPCFFADDPHAEAMVRRGYAQLALAARFDVAMANSHASAEILRRAVPSFAPALADITIAPPLIGGRRWNMIAAEPVALPKTRRLLLFVGRLVPHKGIVPLLDAFRALLALDSEWSLALVGAPAEGDYGRLIDAYFAEHRAALDGRVTLLHGISDGALKSVYKRANLFLTLSRHEGFCVPLFEAMAFDLPIVARAEPAIAEVLGDGGLLLPDSGPEDIARAIKRLMDDRAALAQLAQRRQHRLNALCELADGVPVWRALEKVLRFDARPV